MIRFARVCMWLGVALAVAGCGSDDPDAPKTTTCDGAKVLCGDRCVNFSSDPAYCGSCSQACDTAQVCSRGECRAACQPGLTDCEGSCAKLKVDPENCGACGSVCTAGLVCSAGTCATSCQTGLATCSGLCIDVTSDFDNCGACGKRCEAGQLCSGGACHLQCEQGLTECASSCVNVGNDPLNCGACGTKCDAGTKCQAGKCVADCGAGMTDCSASCRDTAHDPEHCGACGTVCAGATNALPVCAASTCAFVCSAGFADCDNSPDNGCEADLAASPFHCGVCGHDCLGGTCQAGMCSTMILPGPTINGGPMAIDAKYIYYLNGSALYRWSIGADPMSDPMMVVYDAGVLAVSDMVLAGSDIYTAEMNTGVYRIPVQGTTSMPLATGTGWDTYSLAVHDTYVYFTTRGDGSVRRVSNTGGTPEVLYNKASSSPAWIAVDASNVYWTEDGTGAVMQAPVSGGNALVIAQTGADGIAVGPSFVYWSNKYEGKLYKAPIGGGALEVAATGTSSQNGLPRDKSAIYWTASGKIWRVSFAGGAPLALAAVTQTFGMVTDSQWLYWFDEKGIVRRVPK